VIAPEDVFIGAIGQRLLQKLDQNIQASRTPLWPSASSLPK
jgi:hypothetical protein